MSEPILRIEHLKKHFFVRRGVFGKNEGVLRAVDDVSFSIKAGETLGLVGESGCGKSTTAMLVLRLYAPTSGSILFDDVDIKDLKGPALAAYRKSIQAMFQDPFSSLNPRMRVRDIIAEPLIINTSKTVAEIDERVAEVIGEVGLPAESGKL
jgi:ABC-type oligopeptide transport system ATPase subunit